MPRYKAKPLAEGKLRSSERPFYFRVLLWHTQDDYEAILKCQNDGTAAMCVTDVWIAEADGRAHVRPKLGEIHFVSGSWDINIVAHEAQHAILHRLRYLTPGPDLVIPDQMPGWDVEDEEVIAYEAGAWVEALCAWLTNNDPQSPYPKSLFDR